MTAFYNEIDPRAAAWLRELIKQGHIAPGVVDERPIQDIRPDELTRYTQCHFFAGIGVWSYALRLAGWPDSRPVWTGSCPCQPFSSAGRGAGLDDERHLWPAWFHLLQQRRPPIVFGEQVASKDAGPWLDLVHDDLEAVGYAFGAVAFPSAGVGAPHIRDRLYWVADAAGPGPQGREPAGQRPDAQQQALNEVVRLSGWPTTTKEDARSSARHGYMITGNQGTTLLDAARMAGPARLTVTGELQIGSLQRRAVAAS